MQFPSFLFATLLLAASSVWAQDFASEEPRTCLSVCRAEEFKCLPGMEPELIAPEGDKPCWTCCNKKQ
ncbi:hypothetical protein N7489_010385 [Penicillium chrysogenum]|uniref:Uncharacterized protein n=1 Tax=Penicillium chrysogenum TaxID=5076 RepID=A0ABQ8WUY0_PENCH|nr:uncharacterized protein N7489_010385 [Penicillium chrysogenum]KAJ5229677.1 hypothetical protein N7489_010385 [Penicillium chrysogenum]KAJ5259080.1 hypothetical protein N7524_010636 [Penicillium chrysogenum]KAJ5282439.1 hypothetical protein N7505_000419 [Penicillium chrysogenum]KAJ6169555.1 hypothetical protein N7497_002398 [Penicillium chrysogenum]